ncbi:MAG: hypothetical protein GKR90_20200 [Pseudomonadales bacterium]|nr:hypothetical protein [Pseudomonadales bacterium]
MTDGRCLCGAVTFAVVGQPLWVAHCHCESCRRQTGSIPATFVGYEDSCVRYPNTSPQEYESSPGIFRAFCPNCGSAIHYRPVHREEIHLYLGIYDDPARYRASKHVFYDEHVAGYELSDNLPRFTADTREPVAWGSQPSRNILFLCTGNSARSILAEALTNRMSTGGIRAYSAGSQPTGAINSGAATWLSKQGYEPTAFRSKSWDEFTTGPDITWVITLCDSAAAETCPMLPGKADRIHWGLPDPAAGDISFDAVAEELSTLIQTFLASH